MKKSIIFLIYILIAGIVCTNSYIQEKNNDSYRLKTIGETDNTMSVIFSTELSSSEEIYNIVSSCLAKYDGNLYCVNISEKGPKHVYTKYMLINNYEVLDKVPLIYGEFWTKDTSDCYLSTYKTNDPKQIGQVSSFEGNDIYEFKTLRTYFSEENALDKIFALELNNSSDFSMLAEDLKREGVQMVCNFSLDYPLEGLPYITYIVFLSVLVLIFVVIFDVIQSYKELGIKKLMGYETVHIWLDKMIKLILCEIGVDIIAVLLLFLIFVHHINYLVVIFFLKLLVKLLVIVIMTFVGCSIPFIYVKYIPVNAIIKNKKPFLSILIVQTIMKFVTLIVLIVITNYVFLQYKSYYYQKENLEENWSQVLNYVSNNVLVDDYDVFDWCSEENVEKWKNIYRDFNKKGAILADFSTFSPVNEEENDQLGFPANSIATVNTNYLELFTVKDVDGRTVSISENDNDFIVLAPEKFKAQEQDIIDYIEFLKGSYSKKSNDILMKQKTKIIWLANEQEFFSFNITIAINNHNKIKDPIVIVHTLGNSVDEYFDCVLGSMTSNFKIPVEDIENVEEETNQIYGKYFDLTRTGFPMVSQKQAIFDQLTNARDNVVVCIVAIVFLFVIAISIISQTILIYIFRFKKELSVKKLLGYRIVDRYVIYYVYTIICYYVSSCLVVIVQKEWKSIAVALLYLILDIFISTLFIKKNDRENILAVTKGGL